MTTDHSSARHFGQRSEPRRLDADAPSGTAYAEILADLSGGLRAAQTLVDPNWSDRAQLTARAAAADAARSRAVATLGERLDLAQQNEERALTGARRALTDTDDVLTLTRRQQAWERTRMLAEAGRSLSDLIAETTDPVTLAGIYEWAPSWIRAQSIPPDGTRSTQWSEPDTSWIEAQTFARLAQVDDAIGPLATAAVNAAAERARAQAYVYAAESMRDQGTLPVSAKSAIFRADPAGAPLAQAAELTDDVRPAHVAAARTAAEAALATPVGA